MCMNNRDRKHIDFVLIVIIGYVQNALSVDIVSCLLRKHILGSKGSTDMSVPPNVLPK